MNSIVISKLEYKQRLFTKTDHVFAEITRTDHYILIFTRTDLLAILGWVKWQPRVL